MDKYVSFGVKEEVIECDINITYQDFLSNIEEIFNLVNNSFKVIDLTEYNFSEMITTQDKFNLVRSKEDLARERMRNIKDFGDVTTNRVAEDFFLLYGYKTDGKGNTPLMYAVINKNIELIKLIIEKNFKDVHKANNEGVTPIARATNSNNLAIVKLLLEQNFDNAHKEDIDGHTPLINCSCRENLEMIKLILEKRFDNAYKSSNNVYLPIRFAVYENNIEMVKILFDPKYFIYENIAEDIWVTLTWAVLDNKIDIVKLYLEKNFTDTHQRKLNGRSLIEIASRKGYIEMAKLLKEDQIRLEK